MNQSLGHRSDNYKAQELHIKSPFSFFFLHNFFMFLKLVFSYTTFSLSAGTTSTRSNSERKTIINSNRFDDAILTLVFRIAKKVN